jgi:Ras-related protein Rab-8A
MAAVNPPGAGAGGKPEGGKPDGRRSMHYDYLIKLLLIGDSGVGKSSLLLRYTENEFSSIYLSTIGIDFKLKMAEIDGSRCKLQIWDTAGQERFRTITQQYYKTAMGILVLYDVGNETTFLNVRRWLRQIEAQAAPEVNKVLIGNKSDRTADRQVPEARGKQLAEEFGMSFFETSARTGANVDDAFDELTRQVKGRIEPARNTSRIRLGESNQPQQKGCNAQC